MMRSPSLTDFAGTCLFQFPMAPSSLIPVINRAWLSKTSYSIPQGSVCTRLYVKLKDVSWAGRQEGGGTEIGVGGGSGGGGVHGGGFAGTECLEFEAACLS